MEKAKHIGWSISGSNDVWHVGRILKRKQYCVYTEGNGKIVPIAYFPDPDMAELFIDSLEKVVKMAVEDLEVVISDDTCTYCGKKSNNTVVLDDISGEPVGFHPTCLRKFCSWIRDQSS